MQKDTKGKEKVSLIPWSALQAIARAREYGVKKYKANAYKEVPSEQFLEAVIRHVYKFLDGSNYDDESKLHHLDHAIASLAMAIDNLNLVDRIPIYDKDENQELFDHADAWEWSTDDSVELADILTKKKV